MLGQECLYEVCNITEEVNLSVEVAHFLFLKLLCKITLHADYLCRVIELPKLGFVTYD